MCHGIAISDSKSESRAVPLPFDFPWYGESETTITVGVDGLITFGAVHPASGVSEPLPCAGECPGMDYGDSTERGVDGVIAPFWADLDVGESGAVYVQAFAESVVVQWDEVLYGTLLPGPVGLALSIPSLDTHACSGEYFATAEVVQGHMVYRHSSRMQFVYWHSSSGGKWLCDSDTDPSQISGKLPSPTEVALTADDAKWSVDGALEPHAATITLILSE
jgi:hypothetical protein